MIHKNLRIYFWGFEIITWKFGLSLSESRVVLINDNLYNLQYYKDLLTKTAGTSNPFLIVKTIQPLNSRDRF